MKALVLRGKNLPLNEEEIPDPQPGDNEVVVRILAAALNHRDLWIQKGQYAGLKYPIVPGSDGSGVVWASGNNSHPDWKGKEVIINPSLHWGAELDSQDPQHFKILGLPDDGTFAQYVRVPVKNLTEKPAHLDFEQAAALPLAGLTAFRALHSRAGLQAGEKILITGIGGGVAILALQFALAGKAQVYCTSGSQEKLALAANLGARAGVNYKDENWMEQLRDLAGAFDVILDGAAGDGIAQLLQLAAPGGRILIYGATLGNPTQMDMRKVFWKQLNILGTTMGSPADFQSMVEFVNRHRIVPVIDKIFPMDKGEKAMRRMDEASQFGKIVIKVN
jgi:NADPH:quinone reductase-like Zn-dependent oxidoreductase